MAKRDIYNSYVFHQTSPNSEYSGNRMTYGCLFNFCIFKHSMSIESLSKPSGMLIEFKYSKQKNPNKPPKHAYVHMHFPYTFIRNSFVFAQYNHL